MLTIHHVCKDSTFIGFRLSALVGGVRRWADRRVFFGFSKLLLLESSWLISQSFCWLCKIFSNIALATTTKTTKTKKTTKTMTTRECCSTDWRAKVFLGFATISQTLTPTRSSTFFVLQGPKECFLACLKISEFSFVLWWNLYFLS